MAKVQTLLVLTLIAVVQMYETDLGEETADYQDDFEDIDMDSEAGPEMYHRLVKRNGPIWRPKAVNNPRGGSNNGLSLRNGPWRAGQVATGQNLNKVSSPVGGGGGYRMEEENFFPYNSGPDSVFGYRPWNSQKVHTEQVVRGGSWNPIKTHRGRNGPWNMRRVLVTSGGDYEEPVWVENTEEIFEPLNTWNGEQIILEMEDPRGNGKDVTLSCKVMPKQIETPIEPINTFFMDDRKRDVVKQAYSKAPKQERPNSKSAEGNLGAKDKAKGQVNIIRKTIKPDLKLKKQNSLKTDVTKAT